MDVLFFKKALTAYQQEYTARTYPHWDSVQNLLVYMEETEEKLPELSQQVPKYNNAKESLTKYVEANKPYIAPTDVKWLLWLNKSVWLERPFWQYLMVWGLVSLACVLGIFSGYSLAQSTVHARHTPEAVATHKQDLETAVLDDLKKRCPTYYFLFIRDDDRQDYKGYFFIVHCFDQPIPENETPQTLPTNYFIFYVDTNGKIEDPIFEATTLQDETGTRQVISIDARASLIEKLTKKLNNEETNDLIITLALPTNLTDLSPPQQKRVAIVNVSLQQGQICDLFIFLQRRYPQENWLGV